MRPQVPKDGYGVLLMGEALGEDEAAQGLPFVGRAGFKLTRLIEWAGFDRAKFGIINAVWCRPPGNRLEGEAYESGAVNYCRQAHWGQLVAGCRVVVPMGNVALAAFTGRKGILSQRGYVDTRLSTPLLLPTIHPSFIQRGQSKYSAAFINDVQKAVRVAKEGLPHVQTDYLIDPSPATALRWAATYRQVLAADPRIRLAYDIETPGKGEDEGEVDDEDPTYTIWRIGFSYRPLGALTVSWTPEYMAAIRLVMESPGEKVVWNASYDNPRIRYHGIGIGGLVHDGMVAWHILHSDLPKGLGFVATFTCPWQPAWKHLSGSHPGYYNCTDADVEARSFAAIEGELKRVGLWDVYDRDVLQLEPILQHMALKGMPVDAEVREDRARQLAVRQREVKGDIETLVPVEIRSWLPKDGYTKAPADTAELVTIRVRVPVRRCVRCGLPNPTKPHVKTLKRPTATRPQNRCAGATTEERVEEVERYARLTEFKPSRDLLLRYQTHLRRAIPTVYDKRRGKRRPSMNEKALKELAGKYGGDPIYLKVLTYRSLEKIAGTYIGRYQDASNGRDADGDGRPDTHDLHPQPLDPAAEQP